MKNAATTIDLNIENFVCLLKLSMEWLVKVWWSATTFGINKEVLAGESKSAIAERLGRLLKLYFIWYGYFKETKATKVKEYSHVLFGL